MVYAYAHNIFIASLSSLQSLVADHEMKHNRTYTDIQQSQEMLHQALQSYNPSIAIKLTGELNHWIIGSMQIRKQSIKEKSKDYRTTNSLTTTLLRWPCLFQLTSLMERRRKADIVKWQGIKWEIKYAEQEPKCGMWTCCSNLIITTTTVIVTDTAWNGSWYPL